MMLILALLAGCASTPTRVAFGLEWEQLSPVEGDENALGPNYVAFGDNEVYLADIPSSKVLVLDLDGRFVDAWRLTSITPRLRFLGFDGKRWLVLNDQALSWSSQGGKVTGYAGLGLTLPTRLWARGGQVFARVDDGNQGYVLKWATDGGAPTRQSLRMEGRERPALQDGRIWMTVWKDQMAVYHGEANLPDDAELLGWNDSGQSVWGRKGRQAELWWVDDRGLLWGAPQVVTWPGFQGQGLVAGSDLRVLVHGWDSSGLAFVTIPPPAGLSN